MNQTELSALLDKIKDVRLCVIGDVCLDLYWLADMKRSRLSRETPHFPLPVVEERPSLGGGANVMANAAALGVREVLAVSAVGNDWRGVLLRRAFEAAGLRQDLLIADGARVTPCYCKPLRRGIADVIYEDPRLDFENYAPLSEPTENALLAALERAARTADAIAVCDQLEYGVITPKIRARLEALAKDLPVIVDSRSRIGEWRGVIVKPNETEAAAALGKTLPPGEAAAALHDRTNAPVIVTLGERGAVWYENGSCAFTPAKKLAGATDPVGAGDTFLSAFAAAYAAERDGAKALSFAALCSAVTVGKLGVTGTAAPEEILKMNEVDPLG